MPATSSSRQSKWSWGRIFTLLVGVGAGIVGAYYGQPLIHGNDLAINVIVTAFSILAGFLIAIMTIIGDPSSFSRYSWRAHELSRSTVFRGLRRQQWLFMLYLATVCAMFSGSLLAHSSGRISAWILVWLERMYLFMAILAFVVSFRLPGTLLRIQLARHDDMIEARKKSSASSRQPDADRES